MLHPRRPRPRRATRRAEPRPFFPNRNPSPDARVSLDRNPHPLRLPEQERRAIFGQRSLSRPLVALSWATTQARRATMSAKFACVVTTIQAPTQPMRRLAERLSEASAPLIVVGDKKGPLNFDLPGARFVALSEQLNLPFTLVKLLPTGHYVRKNLGYLLAIASGATSVYETDDDNAPLDSWQPRELQVQATSVTTQGWFNVYTRFTDQKIWPRGFPLRFVRPDNAPWEGEAPSEPSSDSSFILHPSSLIPSPI